MRLIAYLRCETEGQIDGYGFSSQKVDISKRAELEGHEIIAWMEELNGSKALDETSRPVFFEALERIKTDPGIDGMIVANLGRFSRETIIQETCFAKIRVIGGQVMSAHDVLVL